ncbi:MAG TPA: hypothetical protein VN728_13725 [Stellaceae bacterium]|jgi:hypothetical protein|nr:hypothetical protein [Stellaceae bacterium]
MSFDIFLHCFRKGEPEPIPRAMFDAIFAPHDTHPHLREEDPGYIVVEYPDGSGGSIYCGGYEDGKDTSHMMFNHCGGPSFWADLYELAARSKAIIFWPSENPIYLYTDPSVPAELKGMEYFEEARSVLIQCGADIENAIASS